MNSLVYGLGIASTVAFVIFGVLYSDHKSLAIWVFFGGVVIPTIPTIHNDFPRCSLYSLTKGIPEISEPSLGEMDAFRKRIMDGKVLGSA